jgi:DNA-directed RNA polymerases I, II, and III subunit RPABC2
MSSQSTLVSSLERLVNVPEGHESEYVNVEDTYSNIATKEKFTRPYITSTEKAKMIGIRSEQLARGSQPNIEVPNNVTSVIKIAELEFYAKKIPFLIRRKLPDGTYEDWALKDFKN